MYQFSDLLVNSKNCICSLGWLWIWKDKNLLLIREVYDQIASSHSDYQIIISFLACNYHWPKMKDKVHCWIWNCHTYSHAIALTDWYNGLLKSLLILIYLWTNITLDFVTGLLPSNSYNIDLIVIDQLIKENHYILYIMDKNGKTVEATTYLLLKNIWKFYGFPLSFTLDWGF